VIDSDAELEALQDRVVGAEPLGSDNERAAQVHVLWKDGDDETLRVQLDDLARIRLD
jgi:hypothetical protein